MRRRERLRVGWAALLVVAVFGVAGCQSAVHQRSHSGGSAAGQARNGGDLRVGVLDDLQPKTFLQINQPGPDGIVSANVFDTLIRYANDKLDVRPALATAWHLAPDGLSLTLDLRQGVTFHDGRPFVSSDVENSIKTYLGGPWTPQFKRTAAAITSYDTTDPHRVVLHFEHPLSNIFDLLDSAPILDQNSLADLKAGKKFIGTGPYKFASWTPNSTVKLVRNDQYWGGAPKLDSITLVVGKDPESLYTRLRTGQLDVAFELASHDQRLATSRYGFTNISLSGGEAQEYVGVNVTNPTLRDVRVRKAIAYAIDRKRIIDDVYQGSGYPINVPWPKTSPAYDPAANTVYTRDVAKAKALVAQVGSIPTVDLDYSTQGSDRVIAEIVQSNLKDVGITVNLVPNDQTVQGTKLIAGTYSGLWIQQHAFAQYTPSTLAVTAYPFNAAKNSSHYQNDAYTAAANAAWLAPLPTSPAAVNAYRELDRRWLDDLFLVEIGVVIPQAAAAPDVSGVDWDRRDQPHFAGTYFNSAGRS
ncbi:ABC transporter substrate-binding protein [Jongsikchunia kroppenstedtii]|uniref:ABC transporter substrate-binding protein n=1 Tax=Jongsikchunia kroppenstedtii TaxID=1121721 RepID=UPI0003734F1E|nr:ABC transporter substrate-binding protein [Jongsikchunia kroppenstedtii]